MAHLSYWSPTEPCANEVSLSVLRKQQLLWASGHWHPTRQPLQLLAAEYP